MENPRLWNPENSSRNPGILLAIEIGNPSSSDKESAVQCLESRIQHWLGLPSMGRITSFIGYCKIMRGTGSKSGPQTVPWCSSTTRSTITCSNLTMTSKQAAPVKYESWKVSFATHGVISLLASVAGEFVCLAGKWVAKPWRGWGWKAFQLVRARLRSFAIQTASYTGHFLHIFSHDRFVEAVSPEVLDMFREAAQALVDKMGAVDAVAASLAHISGTKEIKSRSLLTGREVAIT